MIISPCVKAIVINNIAESRGHGTLEESINIKMKHGRK